MSVGLDRTVAVAVGTLEVLRWLEGAGEVTTSADRTAV